MTTLFITMISIFVAYLALIWINYGLQKSISMSYYSLPDSKKYLFTFFCWGIAIPAIILGSTGLMFLAGAGIAFVGAAAAIKEAMTRTVHMISAVVGITASQIAIFYDFHLWYLNVIFLVVSPIIILVDKKHRIWWIEVLAFILIYIALGLKLFVQ